MNTYKKHTQMFENMISALAVYAFMRNFIKNLLNSHGYKEIKIF